MPGACSAGAKFERVSTGVKAQENARQKERKMGEEDRKQDAVTRDVVSPHCYEAVASAIPLGPEG